MYLELIPNIIRDTVMYLYYLKEEYKLKRFISIIAQKFANVNIHALDHLVNYLYGLTKNISLYRLIFTFTLGLSISLESIKSQINKFFELINSGKIMYTPNILKYLDYYMNLIYRSNVPEEINEHIKEKIAIINIKTVNEWRKIDDTCVMLTEEELNVYIKQVYDSESECLATKSYVKEALNKAYNDNLNESLINGKFFLADKILKYKLTSYKLDLTKLFNVSEIINPAQMNFIYEETKDALKIGGDYLTHFKPILITILLDLISKKDNKNYNLMMNLLLPIKDEIYADIANEVKSFFITKDYVMFWNAYDPILSNILDDKFNSSLIGLR